jgi:putative NIF3 family GTP cyclohydrolase 1 type 2
MVMKSDKGDKLTTLTAVQKAIVDINKKGFGKLILSIDCNTPAGKVAFSMVKNTKTTENPDGSLRQAYLRLKAKFEPSTTPHLMQLTREFHSKSLGRNQDPDIFITELEELKIKMIELDHDITEKSMILHILNNLNENYNMEIKML